MVSLLTQASLAVAFYASVVAMFRLAGKRLAGQTTTFDLIVLISLGVAIQGATLRDGPGNAVVFFATVFGLHVALARSCLRWPQLRKLVRGNPRPLVRDGDVLRRQLAEEGMCEEELRAGLRKAGFSDPKEVKLAYLEETGHISVLGKEPAQPAAERPRAAQLGRWRLNPDSERV